jgi:flagellar motor component MotA
LLAFAEGMNNDRKLRIIGWLLFALMCTSMGILMLIQDKALLVFQQGISLLIIIVGYIRATPKLKLIKL